MAETPSSISSPPPDPSPHVRVMQQIRETLTDIAGLVLAGYLVHRGAISGQHALLFALALLLPSQVLVRLAKMLGTRGASGAAIALLSAATVWTKVKSWLVVGAGVVSMAACLAGCRMPAPDGCTPGSRRCHEDTPQVCSPGQRWTPADVRCSTVGSVCVMRAGVPACLREVR